MGKPAIFWDRDKTLIADPGYINSPDQVALLPEAADAIQQLATAGYENIIVTNQSGIARGLCDEPTLLKIHELLRELLRAADTDIDAIYYCPYLDGPEAVVEQYRQASDLRKPKPGMLVQAAMERKLNLAASWCIGDSIRDVEAGRAAGTRTILLNPAGQHDDKRNHPAVDFLAHSLSETVSIILRHTIDTNSRKEPVGATVAIGDEITVALQDILNFMKATERRRRTEDFSLAHLAASICQVFAIGAFIWAIFDLLGTRPPGVALLASIFLQLLTLTLAVFARQR